MGRSSSVNEFKFYYFMSSIITYLGTYLGNKNAEYYLLTVIYKVVLYSQLFNLINEIPKYQVGASTSSRKM